MRKLSALILLAMLIALVPASVFAEEPVKPAETDATVYAAGLDLMLGDVVYFFLVAFDPITGDLLPNWPVGVYLGRPDTIGGYAWAYPANFFDPTDWIAWQGASNWRRQTWPKYASSDVNGFYYAKFMLPRDEAWYPCSYPCKWKCNVYDPWTASWVEFHSPKAIGFEYPYSNPDVAWYYMTHYPLFWPWDVNWVDPWMGYVNYYGPWPWYDYYWYDWTVLDAAPFDTVHPLWIAAAEDFGGWIMYEWENKVWGYWWRPSDLEIQYPEEWPYICGDPYSWPVY